MTEKYIFAAVDLPFHVWVKEGSRWVLREARADATRGSTGDASKEKAAQRAA